MRSSRPNLTAFAHTTCQLFSKATGRRQFTKWTCSGPLAQGRGVWDLPQPSRSHSSRPTSRPRSFERRTGDDDDTGHDRRRRPGRESVDFFDNEGRSYADEMPHQERRAPRRYSERDASRSHDRGYTRERPEGYDRNRNSTERDPSRSYDRGYTRERPERYGRNRDSTWIPDRDEKEMTEIREALSSDDDLLYGVNPVLFALRSGRRPHFHTLYVQKNAAGSRKTANEASCAEIQQLATRNDIPIRRMDKGELNVLSGNRPHQGVVLRAGALEPAEVKSFPREEKALWLVLDEVTDPQNAGSLIRSAHFLGAAGVALCKRNSTRLTPVVSKASAGAAEVCDVRGVASLPRLLKRAREEGWTVVGMAAEGGVDVREVRREGPTIVVVGSEGEGLRPLVREACDVVVRIEGGGLDSLNVGVAGGIALYELLR